MLDLPEIGLRRSVRAHNVDLDILCDWLEACVLFGPERISGSDVVDFLTEGEIYDSQDFAWELLGDSWSELRRRHDLLGLGAAVKTDGKSLVRVREWEGAAAYTFCLVLSLARPYRRWAASFGADHTLQGELFEILTREALVRMFPGWEIHLTAWNRTQRIGIEAVVRDVAGRLGEAMGEIEPWTDHTAHEAGLDILCYRSFDDHRSSLPVYFMQCASGKHYEEKLHSPDLRIWGSLIKFLADPKRALSTPYVLLSDEFKRVARIVDGVLLDRCRLLSPGRAEPNWVSAELKERLVPWLRERIDRLPLHL